MLEAVGHPVAVNPDRVLAKVAREREWEVMQFTKPVRLRDRVPRSEPADDRGRRHRRGGVDRRAGALADDAAGRTRSAPSSARQRERRARLRPANRQLGLSAGRSGGAQPLGGDDTEGDDDGEDQELLHGVRSYRVRIQFALAARRPAGDPVASGAAARDGRVRR